MVFLWGLSFSRSQRMADRQMKPSAFCDAESIRIGQSCEDLFVLTAKKALGPRLLSITPSTPTQDKREHWDYALTTAEGAVKVDVKARRKMNRSDADAQDLYFPVEFVSVSGKKGWIYGDADVIAFEVLHAFVLVERSAYASMAEKLVDMGNFVDRASDAVYKCYTRKGRRDLFSWIKRADLLSIPHEIWMK